MGVGGERIGAEFDVLRHDLTSTNLESDVERRPEDLRRFGYSREKRGDRRQGVVAAISAATPQSKVEINIGGDPPP